MISQYAYFDSRLAPVATPGAAAFRGISSSLLQADCLDDQILLDSGARGHFLKTTLKASGY